MCDTSPLRALSLVVQRALPALRHAAWARGVGRCTSGALGPVRRWALALAAAASAAGPAVARAQDVRVQPCYSITVAQTGTVQATQLCLVSEPASAWETCRTPSLDTGQARFTICQPGAPRFVRGVARNGFGSSLPSAHVGEFRSVADANGDWAVSVSDMISVNRVIFGGLP